MGHCLVLPLLCPQSTGASLWVYRHGNYGTKASCWCFPASLIPYKFLIHAAKARALMKWSCWITLNKVRFWRGVVFRGSPVDLPGTKVPVAACLRRMWLIVARVRLMRPVIALCLMPSRASASTSCLIPVGVGRNIIRTIYENWDKKKFLLIVTCHSAKADLGKWPHKLWLWTLRIPLGTEVKVRPRKGRIS